jgi:hypothetical protein
MPTGPKGEKRHGRPSVQYRIQFLNGSARAANCTRTHETQSRSRAMASNPSPEQPRVRFAKLLEPCGVIILGPV